MKKQYKLNDIEFVCCGLGMSEIHAHETFEEKRLDRTEFFELNGVDLKVAIHHITAKDGHLSLDTLNIPSSYKVSCKFNELDYEKILIVCESKKIKPYQFLKMLVDDYLN